MLVSTLLGGDVVVQPTLAESKQPMVCSDVHVVSVLCVTET